MGVRGSAVINMEASSPANFYCLEWVGWVVSPEFRSVCFSAGLRSTEHELESQVEIPNLGSTQSCSASQMIRTPTAHMPSFMFPSCDLNAGVAPMPQRFLLRLTSLRAPSKCLPSGTNLSAQTGIG
jgi:hypothetical protein